MRVIAGQYRGRKLKSPRGTRLRPTSDKLKETLFDVLGPSLQDSLFLDLFAGAGGIGLEALSRGAREVIFIESNRDACRLIQENLRLCGINGSYRILQYDVFTALRSLGRDALSGDTMFLDPPYEWGPYRDLLELIFRTGIAREESLVVVEHHRKAVLPESGDGYQRIRTIHQSHKRLSIFMKS